MIIEDFHTHTTYSHGKCSVAYVAQLAYERGITVLAISEHSHGNMFYGVSEANFIKIREEIAELNVAYKGKMRIMTGVELNLLGDGRTDMPNSFTPDVALLGYHRGIALKNSFARHALAESFFKVVNAKRNTDELIRVMNNYDINILAHPGEYISIELNRLARAAAELNILFEINNRHVTFTADDLKLAADCGVRFVISSDAHTEGEVACFDNAIKVATAAEVLPLVVNWRECCPIKL